MAGVEINQTQTVNDIFGLDNSETNIYVHVKVSGNNTKYQKFIQFSLYFMQIINIFLAGVEINQTKAIK